jgi:predicted MPP superfamily phosphohydrolase
MKSSLPGEYKKKAEAESARIMSNLNSKLGVFKSGDRHEKSKKIHELKNKVAEKMNPHQKALENHRGVLEQWATRRQINSYRTPKTKKSFASGLSKSLNKGQSDIDRLFNK